MHEVLLTDKEDLGFCCRVLKEEVSSSVNDKYSAVFTCRNADDQEKAIEILSHALYCSSELIAHEAAYALGQIKNPAANKVLIKCLKNNDVYPIVHHEALEALGAINSPTTEVLDIINEKLLDINAPIEVKETAHLALERIKFFQTKIDKEEGYTSPFKSIDPAPHFMTNDVEFLSELLYDTSQDLFDRYRAIFSLRNLQSDEAVNILGNGFQESSNLFKHEIAYVLGEMGRESAIPFLEKMLRDSSQHPMVRHESAESLGSIQSEKANSILKEFLTDPVQIVRESVIIALNENEYL